MRSPTREHIELLVEKKLCGTITPEEQVWLDSWLNQEQEEQMIWNSDDPDELAFRERLLQRIREDAGISIYSQQDSKVFFLQRYKRAAAAILLLIAGSLSYLLLARKGVAPVGMAHNNAVMQDVAPGHSGAILILANGNKIFLDSAGNGKIAIQGNRRLVKKNGQLVYEKATGETSSKSIANSDGNVIYNTITTPRGREFQIILADGSKVWLNAASSITYPTAFTGQERKITVTGEAYLEVAKDSRHPFIVSVGETRITVLGTRFDVMAYADENRMKTTLLEGSVQLSRGDQQVIITPGQQASFSVQSDHMDVTTVDAKQAIAWVEGELSLDNLDVGTIMRRISRWYDVDVEFEGPISDERYWGLINRDVNLSNMLKIMRANGINANFRDNKIMVSSDN